MKDIITSLLGGHELLEQCGFTYKKPVLAENMQISFVPIITYGFLNHILKLTPTFLIYFNILKSQR